jgi:hypothetical protein
MLRICKAPLFLITTFDLFQMLNSHACMEGGMNICLAASFPSRYQGSSRLRLLLDGAGLVANLASLGSEAALSYLTQYMYTSQYLVSGFPSELRG